METWWFKNKIEQFKAFIKYIKLVPDLKLRSFVILIFICFLIISFFTGLTLGKNIESKKSIKITNSIRHTPYNEIMIEKAISGGSALYAKDDSEKNFVASDGGKVYYYKTCKGYTRIKPENRVWFNTETDAKLSGYKIAKNCSYK